MRFFSARLNFDNGIVLKFDGFVVNLFQYKTALADILQRPRFYQTLLIRDLQVQALA